MSDRRRPHRLRNRVLAFLAVTGSVGFAAAMVFNALAGDMTAALACLALLMVDTMLLWVLALDGLTRAIDDRRRAELDELARALMLGDQDAYDRVLRQIGGR